MRALFPKQAAQALRAALKRNPYSLRGRFWSGLLAEQDGRKSEAEKIYRDMLADQINPTLRNIVTERLQALMRRRQRRFGAGRSGIWRDSEDGQGKMIRGMVERLAAKLKETNRICKGG